MFPKVCCLLEKINLIRPTNPTAKGESMLWTHWQSWEMLLGNSLSRHAWQTLLGKILSKHSGVKARLTLREHSARHCWGIWESTLGKRALEQYFPITARAEHSENTPGDLNHSVHRAGWKLHVGGAFPNHSARRILWKTHLQSISKLSDQSRRKATRKTGRKRRMWQTRSQPPGLRSENPSLPIREKH